VGDDDVVTERIADLARQARNAAPVDRVLLLAQAAGLASNPLQRTELLMLLADAAGRAAHAAADAAQRGEGMPEGRPATWAQIGDAAAIPRETAYRQFHGGQALSWPPAARGVRHGSRTEARS
jgi:hypothetical protein